MHQDLVRLDNFDGSNFRRWQQKVLFLLTSLKIAYVLTESCPEREEGPGGSYARKKWKEHDYLCKSHILNLVADNIYNMYSEARSAKDLWRALDRKYKTEESGAKKYAVGRYLNFKMADDKPILPQVHDLQTIVNEIVKEGIRIDEQFQVATVIEKLPSTWKDIQKTLRHKRKDYSLERLQRYLRIEEEARISDQKDLAENGGKINLAESKPQVDNEKKGKFDHPLGRNKKSNPSFKRKNPNKNQNKRFNKNQGTVKPQAKGSCFVCGKPGHFARECRHRKKCPQQSQPTKPQANVTEEEQFVAVISEVNAVSTGKSEG